MDFKDWRPSAQDPAGRDRRGPTNRIHGKRAGDYLEEQICDAEERGVFANLPGYGKPLNLDADPYAGDKSLAYSLLKNNDALPAELEMVREVDQMHERLEARSAILVKRGRDLRQHPLRASAEAKSAYRQAVTEGLAAYERGLRALNSKILTLNLSVPVALHRPPLKVEELVEKLREECWLP